MKVSEAMPKDPVTSTLESSVFQAVIIMTSREIGSILAPKGDELKGIVTERTF